MNEEVKKVFEMLKNEEGFDVAEIVFEGGLSVTDMDTLNQVQDLVDEKKAFGAVHVIYTNKDGEERVINVSAGKSKKKAKKKLPSKK